MLGFSIFFGICLMLLYCVTQYYVNKIWHRKPMRNFPFIYKGKEFWYSRSVACTLFCFSKNSDGVWHVLANQRGEGTPDFQGLWNVPCGYLDFDETGEECVQRECYEETNVFVPVDKIVSYGVSTNPSENRQNVSLRYYTIIDMEESKDKLSDEHSEKGEVSDIKWIPVNDIDNFEWAFGHNETIKKFLEKDILK